MIKQTEHPDQRFPTYAHYTLNNSQPISSTAAISQCGSSKLFAPSLVGCFPTDYLLILSFHPPTAPQQSRTLTG